MVLTLFNPIWDKPSKRYLSWLSSLLQQDEQKTSLVGSWHGGSLSYYFSLPQRFFHWHNENLQKRSFSQICLHILWESSKSADWRQEPRTWGAAGFRVNWVSRGSRLSPRVRSRTQRSHFSVPAWMSLKSRFQFGNMTFWDSSSMWSGKLLFFPPWSSHVLLQGVLRGSRMASNKGYNQGW